MSHAPRIFGLLTAAAACDWLIGRTLLRTAIHMPKSAPVLFIYRGLTIVSQLALTASGLLVLVALGWIAWRSRASFKGGFSLSLLSLIVLSLVFLVIAPLGWAGLGYRLLALAAIGMIGWQVVQRSADRSRIVAWALPAAALGAAQLHQAGAALTTALWLPGSPAYASPFLVLGEGFVIASGFALWWAYGREARPLWVWLAAGLPALAFSAAYLLQPTLTGIMTIWSIGLTLYLPWPLYAISLWLAGFAAIHSIRRGERVGWAILLLAAGGFAPQLSTHNFLGLVALWLLVPGVKEPAEGRNLVLGLPPHASSPHEAAHYVEG